jgi:hypothetical protein
LNYDAIVTLYLERELENTAEEASTFKQHASIKGYFLPTSSISGFQNY